MYTAIKPFSYIDYNNQIIKINIGDIISSVDIPNFELLNKKYKFCKKLLDN